MKNRLEVRAAIAAGTVHGIEKPVQPDSYLRPKNPTSPASIKKQRGPHFRV